MPEHLYLNPGDDLQKAFDHAAPGDTLYLCAGEYRQKTVLRTPGITLIGEGAGRTVIIWDDYALKRDEFGREYNTFRTYTMAVCAHDVTMRNLAIVNDAGDPQLMGQEVALSVLGDRFVMEDCRLSSTQDTLFAGPLPPDLIERYKGFLADELRASGPFSQRYTRCLIEGSVDFIFGCADAVFEDCEIRSVYDVRQVGYVAAPAHGHEQTKGFLFSRCRFTCAPEVNPASIYLARPWRDYGLARFEHCACGEHIAPEGFDKWNDTQRDKTARFYETPAVPGRVGWMRRAEADFSGDWRRIYQTFAKKIRTSCVGCPFLRCFTYSSPADTLGYFSHVPEQTLVRFLSGYIDLSEYRMRCLFCLGLCFASFICSCVMRL